MTLQNQREENIPHSDPSLMGQETGEREVRSQETGDRRQEREDRRQETGDRRERRQESRDRRQEREDRVADREVDKVADMFKTKCIKPEMF